MKTSSRGMEQMRRNFLEALATALGVAPSQAAENAKRVSLRPDMDALWRKYDPRDETWDLDKDEKDAITKIGELLTEGAALEKKKEDAYSIGLHALILFKKEPSRFLFERVTKKLHAWGAEPEAEAVFNAIAGREVES